jgi:hypothetical protein
MVWATAAARVLLHLETRSGQASLRQLPILPVRDLLSVGLWSWGFVTRSVQWRNDRLRVNRDGSVLPVV